MILDNLSDEYIENLKIRFWSKVDVRRSHECWEWKGGRYPKGYGHTYANGGGQAAHRVSYELTNGPIPDGYFVCHHCDNPPCVNPKHLFVGTVKTNNKDMFNKGRNPETTGENNGASRLTDDQVREIRKKYVFRKYTLKMLGAEYGVHLDTIHRVVTNQTWNHV